MLVFQVCINCQTVRALCILLYVLFGGNYIADSLRRAPRNNYQLAGKCPVIGRADFFPGTVNKFFYSIGAAVSEFLFTPVTKLNF
ncbi:MAG TPA: hypothetical protein DF613_07960 [Lachnospiraceae bacterium]|nr:hypothetical protein [Lachnospiraceae bacterium]